MSKVANPKVWAFAALAIAMFSAPWLVPRLLLGFDSFIPAPLAAEQLRSDRPPLLIDVRSAGEFSLPPGHIPGALNWPVSELEARLNDAGTAPARDRSLLLVCESDWRASAAARAFRAHGYPDFKIIAGGMRAWQAEQLPLSHATPGR